MRGVLWARVLVQSLFGCSTMDPGGLARRCLATACAVCLPLATASHSTWAHSLKGVGLIEFKGGAQTARSGYCQRALILCVAEKLRRVYQGVSQPSRSGRYRKPHKLW